jgi:hypothetical protein
MPTILGANTLSTGVYEVANSCRFNDGDSAFLSKTFSTDGTSHDIGTVSVWLKRGELAAEQGIFTAGSSNRHFIRFESGDTLTFRAVTDSFHVQTTQVFRDPSAWYHIVIAYDTSQGTASNRVKMYVNGSQISSFSQTDYPDQNLDIKLGAAELNAIGKDSEQANPYYDGYMAEFVYIDGQQLTPTSFGEFDEDSNIWKPIDVSGLTFGTNGFYLDFEDSGTLGNDVSGNNNDFASSGLAATDQSTDTCTNNFATWNPLDNARTYTGTIDLSEGNLKQSNANDATLISTIAFNSGKWYMEFKCEDADNTRTFGIIDIAESNGYVGHSSVASAISYGYKSSDGTIWIGTSEQASSVGTTSAGDIVSMAIDLDSSTKTIKWQKNGSDLSGTTQLTISHSTSDYYFGIICRCDGGQVINANFGSPAYAISSGNADANGHGNFEYQVPDGYFALCTKNLAEHGG